MVNRFYQVLFEKDAVRIWEDKSLFMFFIFHDSKFTFATPVV